MQLLRIPMAVVETTIASLWTSANERFNASPCNRDFFCLPFSPLVLCYNIGNTTSMIERHPSSSLSLIRSRRGRGILVYIYQLSIGMRGFFLLATRNHPFYFPLHRLDYIAHWSVKTLHYRALRGSPCQNIQGDGSCIALPQITMSLNGSCG